MGALGWKIKRWFKQLMPFALAALVAWGAYTMFFTRGGFRGPRVAISRVLRHVPFFGSRFRSHSHGGGMSYRSYGARSYRRRYHSPRRSRYHARGNRRRHHGRRR